jgi:hypothetical protein
MVIRPQYGVWSAAILLLAALEILVLPRSAAVQLLAIIGIISGISALHLELARRAALTGPATAPAPPVSRPPAPARPMARVAPAARGVQADAGMIFPAPPRFDERGSSAHAQPWLLPPHRLSSGVAADEAQVGDLAVRAASVVGPGHRCAEPVVPRQDAYQLGRDRAGRYLIAAVADGVSGSRRGDLGATVAAQHAVDALVARLDRAEAPATLSAAEILQRVAQEMSRVAAVEKIDDAEVCAVMVIAVVEAVAGPDGSRRAWIGWLGDVSVWRRVESHWRFEVGDAKGDPGGLRTGEVASVLPMNWSDARQDLLVLAPGETLALVTDGVGDLWSMHPRANDYYHRRWSVPPPVASFVNDVCFDARGEQDDRTAVVVWTPAGGAR